MTDEQIMSLTSEELLAKVRNLYAKGHEILYYGPLSESQLKSVLAESHRIGENAAAMPETYPAKRIINDNEVVLAQYDAKQLYYIQYANRGEKFNAAEEADIDLYNEYFGGGMNSIVFQEMREARGLAYSASATLSTPSYADDTHSFMAFIATQNDKMKIAIEAFDEIINSMPESEAAFSIAKDAIISRMRTQRTTGMGVLNQYRYCRRMGLSEPTDKAVYNALQGLTLDDVKKIQQQKVKDSKYGYMILGDIKDLDLGYLKTLGPVKTVSLEEIFGY